MTPRFVVKILDYSPAFAMYSLGVEMLHYDAVFNTVKSFFQVKKVWKTVFPFRVRWVMVSYTPKVASSHDTPHGMQFAELTGNLCSRALAAFETM